MSSGSACSRPSTSSSKPEPIGPVVRLLTRKISARLSARRRSRFAAPAVLILGLLATGGIWAAVAPAGADSSGPDDEQIQAGRALFAVSCASCHGLNGEGIT